MIVSQFCYIDYVLFRFVWFFDDEVARLSSALLKAYVILH